MKATRHNGRSGKHGTYDAKHNDRRFDVENSEHIDAERTKFNFYGAAIRVIVCRMMRTKGQDSLFRKWKKPTMMRIIQIMWTDRMKEIERQDIMIG